GFSQSGGLVVWATSSEILISAYTAEAHHAPLFTLCHLWVDCLLQDAAPYQQLFELHAPEHNRAQYHADCQLRNGQWGGVKDVVEERRVYRHQLHQNRHDHGDYQEAVAEEADDEG